MLRTATFKRLAVMTANAADDKKGEDILLLDVHKLSTVADYVLIVSTTSPAHQEAVGEEIETALGSSDVHALHHEGPRGDPWRVLDYGGLLVHLMHPEAREFYQIEKFYRDAPRIHWKKESNGTTQRGIVSSHRKNAKKRNLKIKRHVT